MLGKNRFSLAVPALAFALAIVPAVAQAAPAREALRTVRPSFGILSALADWADWLSSAFASVGVGIDPNGGGDGSGNAGGVGGDGGNSTNLPPRLDSDAGSVMDPNGTGSN